MAMDVRGADPAGPGPGRAAARDAARRAARPREGNTAPSLPAWVPWRPRAGEPGGRPGFDAVSTIVWDDRRNARQSLFNHGVHVTGGPLSPSRGIEASGGALAPYPLVAGQADEDGDGTCDYGERHAAHMPNAGYRVHRLTPAGACGPARSPAPLRHGAGGAMHGRDRPGRHGLARGTSAPGEVPGREREIAYLAMMGTGAPEAEAPAAAGPPGPASAGGQLRQLRERIARETGPAGLAMLGSCPGMDGAVPPGGGEAS